MTRLFDPNAPLGPEGTAVPVAHIYRRILGYIAEFRGGVGLSVLLVMLGSLLVTLQPWPIKFVIDGVLASDRLKLFAVELSLDGLPEFHNQFRGNPRSFQMAMRTYDALAEFQRRDSRLRIHAISTATEDNVEEIRKLTTYLHERCPAMDHHNLAIIWGDRKNTSLQGPDLEAYVELDRYRRRLWADREEGRFGGVVDPMLTWAKLATARPIKLAEVVRDLTGRRRQSYLTKVDKDLLSRGRELLAAEIAAVTETQVFDAHATINEMIKREPTTDFDRFERAQATSEALAPATV